MNRPYNLLMSRLTLDYWVDDGWYVGQLREMPAVLSQGRTLAELRANIQDAFQLVMSVQPRLNKRAKSLPITLRS